MPKLTETSQAIRAAQALEVVQLMQTGKTQKDACSDVGISVDVFRRWIAKDSSVLQTLGELKQYTEREILLMISSIQSHVLAILLDRVMSENPMDTKDLLSITKYLDERGDRLAERQGASSASEEKAREYLTGPTLQKAQSKMGKKVNLRVLDDDSIDVTVFSNENVIDAEPVDDDEQATSDFIDS